MRRLVAGIFVLLAGCSGVPQQATPSASPSISASLSPSPVNPNSNIGKTDQFGVVVKVDVPDLPECKRKEQSVEKDTFENCLIEGITLVQASNVIGFEGNLASKSGAIEIRQWSHRQKLITAFFRDGYLISKSQIGL